MLYKILRILVLIIFKIIFRCEIIGAEKIPANTPVIISPNHKSNFDPFLVSALVKPQIHWIAKKELFEFKPLGALIYAVGGFPIDREKSNIKAIKTAMNILKNNKILGLFPEGTRVKKPDFENPKSGVALIAHRTKSTVVPMYIDGNYTPFKKMKLIVRDPMDLSKLPKAEQKDYDSISLDILKSIYGVDENKNYIS
ncbi:1-acyl-sn-glycerol-3-phosphate acyltransferase [Peptoniphilus sp. ING2-D1G]|nr:1-acyl-sn-glycerol-3-phosphate acyltransferase [Peptoniphilus sp. ING2-D1G]